MKRLVFEIIDFSNEKSGSEIVEVITDRTPEWTKNQYLRNKSNRVMNLISETETNEINSSWKKIS